MSIQDKANEIYLDDQRVDKTAIKELWALSQRAIDLEETQREAGDISILEAITAAGRIYSDVAAALSEVAHDGLFFLVNDGRIDLYRNEHGAEVLVRSFGVTSALDAASRAEAALADTLEAALTRFQNTSEMLQSSVTARGDDAIWSVPGMDFVETQGSHPLTAPHVITDAGVNLVALSRSGTFDLEAFGADKSGLSSSSAALQKAVDAAWELSARQTTIGSGDVMQVAPQIIVPPGQYRFDTGVDFSHVRNISIVSPGAVFLGDPATDRSIDLMACEGLRTLNLEGLSFHNFDTVIRRSGNDLDVSMWNVDRCTADHIHTLIDSGPYVGARSTVLNITRSDFRYRVTQLLRTTFDHLNIDKCWLGTTSDTTDYILANSSMDVRGCVFVPSPQGTQDGGNCFIRLSDFDNDGGTVVDEHRGVLISGCRASNEGGNGPLVVVDYGRAEVPVSPFCTTPAIVLDGVHINAWHPWPYDASDSETGVVQLLKWPGTVSFKNCGFPLLGADHAKLIAKSDALASAAPDGFLIDVDDATYHAAVRAASEVEGRSIAGAGVRGFIRSPDPLVFRDILEDGFLRNEAGSVTGQRKCTFRIKTGYLDDHFVAPISFHLHLEGFGDTLYPDFGNAGSSQYIVNFDGYIDAGAKMARVSATKLSGGIWGSSETANADIVSIHFGAAESGAGTAPMTAEMEITVVYGVRCAEGRARIIPISQRVNRFAHHPH